MRRVAVAILLALTLRSAGAAPIACPSSLPAAGTGFEQIGASPPAPAGLDMMRLFDGQAGEEQRPSPAELAPDSASQRAGSLNSSWIFAGNENLLLVCTYRGTKAYYRIQVPQPIKTCTLRRDSRRSTGACL